MFVPARDRLVTAFDQWTRRQRRAVDPFVVEALVQHRWAAGDGILCRWQRLICVRCPIAAGRYIADVNDGRIAVDKDLLNQVVNNHLTASAQDPPPPLPVVAMPDEATVARSAAESVALTRIRRFAAWVSPGRTLTATGRLRLADAREVISLLDLADVIDPPVGGTVYKTRSSDELYETSVVFAWARAAGVVRVVKGRLVPVKSAAKLLADPVALAHRAFEVFFDLGEAVCPLGYVESLVRRRFDDVTSTLLTGLYIAQDRVDTADLKKLAVRVAEEDLLEDADPDHPDRWRLQGDDDAGRLLTQLGLLGVITATGGQAALTPLGTALIAGHLRHRGITVPTVRDLLDETAEVVVAAAAGALPAVRDELLTGWCGRHPDTAAADLTALARRTDDPDHRELARKYASDA